MTGREQGRFSIDSAKLAAVTAASGVEPDYVRQYCLDYDWTNADEHQAWLDSASVSDIAAWVQEIRESERQAFSNRR